MKINPAKGERVGVLAKTLWRRGEHTNQKIQRASQRVCLGVAKAGSNPASNSLSREGEGGRKR
jgi:hypothetical protein